MATYTKIVDPGNEQTEWSTDYTSISAWEVGEQTAYLPGDIAIADCRRSTSSKDTSEVLVTGWTLGVTPKIVVNDNFRHEGKIADQRADGNYIYTLEVTPGVAAIYNYNTSGLVVEGLLIKVNCSLNGDRNGVRYFSTSGDIIACIIEETSEATLTAAQGVRVINTSESGTVQVINSVICNFDGTGLYVSGIVGTGSFCDLAIYNTTIFNCRIGIRREQGSILSKNNIAMDNSRNSFYGPFASGSDYNISSDTTAPGNNTAKSKASYSIYFEDHINGDFHLKNTSNNLFSLSGTDLSGIFTDDIDGDVRSNWDVGADEYVSVGGGLLPINGSLSSATGMTAGFNGRSGAGGGLDVATVNPCLQQVGRSGLSGDLATNSSSPRLELLQISKSEPVSRIGMAVQSGSVAFPGPEFGKIEISTITS